MTKVNPKLLELQELLAQKEEELCNQRQQRHEAEARAITQITKLSENNASLARQNDRLSQLLEKSKRELDRLSHLNAGSQAVSRAKEAELAAEIAGLKNLLKESLSERGALHAQLLAKQEVVRYLEWRLAQVQRLADTKQNSASPKFRGPLAAAFSAAAKGEEEPDDSFAVRSDSNTSSASSNPVSSAPGFPRTLQALGHRGLVGIPATTWFGAAVAVAAAAGVGVGAATPRVEDEANKENLVNSVGPTPRTLPRRNSSTPLATIPLDALAVDTLPLPAEIISDSVSLVPPSLEDRPPSPPPARTVTGSNGNGNNASDDAVQQRPLEEVQIVIYRDNAAAEDIAPPAAVSAALADGDGVAQPVQTENNDTEEDLEEQTPLRHEISKHSNGEQDPQEQHEGGDDNEEQNGESQEDTNAARTPMSAPRSSTRVRRPVSYALPSVRRKLRQGDPFTFGDAKAFKKIPRSRTKPRARHTVSKGSRSLNGPSSSSALDDVRERSDSD